MTVLSLNVLLAVPRRVKRTGIRTGVALGKNFANLSDELGRFEEAAAVPGLDTECLNLGTTAAWAPQPAG